MNFLHSFLIQNSGDAGKICVTELTLPPNQVSDAYAGEEQVINSTSEV